MFEYRRLPNGADPAGRSWSLCRLFPHTALKEERFVLVTEAFERRDSGEDDGVEVAVYVLNCADQITNALADGDMRQLPDPWTVDAGSCSMVKINIVIRIILMKSL